MTDLNGEQTELAGPLENGAFPELLPARVVTPGERPRLHGYDVEEDLARHYHPTDVLYLSLLEELPTPEVSAALSVVLTFLSPVSVAHASTHAAVLSRLCGSATSSTIGIAAIGLAEQARSSVLEHASLLDWLDSPWGTLPAAHQASDAADDAAVDRFRAALAGTGVRILALDQRPTRSAALFIALHALGFRTSEKLEAVIVTARLPTALAEAFTTKVVDFRSYPINLPRYVYEES